MAEYVPNDGMRSVDVSELACSGIDPKKAISCSIPIGMFGRGFRVTKKHCTNCVILSDISQIVSFVCTTFQVGEFQCIYSISKFVANRIVTI